MPIDPAWLQQQLPNVSGVARLADGGQKWVFTANHVTNGEVVIKVILPGQNIARTQREIIAVQQVASQRVPPIFEVGTLTTNVGPVVWLREQRIVGDSVRTVLSRGALDRDGLLRFGLHVLEALVSAEIVRIVHRDVKPDNVMMDGQGSFWLLDFGVARHLDLTSLTPSADRFGQGTAGYAPPEQFKNVKRDIDARADLFALGVTLHECATGRNPLRTGARDVAEVLRRTESMPIPRLTLGWDASGEFGDLVLALTQRRRDHRPSTATDALAWIRSVAAVHGIN
jgi:serine/threonine protein kinase